MRKGIGDKRHEAYVGEGNPQTETKWVPSVSCDGEDTLGDATVGLETRIPASTSKVLRQVLHPRALCATGSHNL